MQIGERNNNELRNENIDNNLVIKTAAGDSVSSQNTISKYMRDALD